MSDTGNPPEGPKYWAFLSYSHVDAVWAKRLHCALESYRVPRRLTAKLAPDGVAAPRRLIPVFLDQLELPTAPDLAQAVEQALRSSRFLIVICSPDAARSRWVAEEIRRFQQAGGRRRVMCLLVGGEPHASDRPESAHRECFPPPLRSEADGVSQPHSTGTVEPLAADVRPGKDRFEDAKLKLIAGMLGVGLDELRQRERQRQHQRLALVAAALLILAAGSWWWAENYVWPQAEYFGRVKKIDGVATGIDRLNSRAMRGRQELFKLTRKGRRGEVMRAEIVDGSGKPTEPLLPMLEPYIAPKHGTNVSVADATPVLRIDYEYRADGGLSDEISIDQNGRELHRLHYLPDAPGLAVYRKAGEDQPFSENGASHVRFERQATGSLKGVDLQWTFEADHKVRTPNDDGIYGVRHLEFTPAGLPTRVHFLDENHAPLTAPNQGWKEVINEYDAAHQVRRIRLVLDPAWNAGQAPVIHEVLVERDFRQNITALVTQMSMGDQNTTVRGDVVRSKSMISTRRRISDGEVISVTYLWNRARRLEQRWGFSTVSAVRDREGRLRQVALLNSKAKPAKSRPFVSEVLPKSEAARAGLQEEDIVVSYNGTEVPDANSLAALTADTANGARELRVLRGGEELTFTVQAGKLGVNVSETFPKP